MANKAASTYSARGIGAITTSRRGVHKAQTPRPVLCVGCQQDAFKRRQGSAMDPAHLDLLNQARAAVMARGATFYRDYMKAHNPARKPLFGFASAALSALVSAAAPATSS